MVCDKSKSLFDALSCFVHNKSALLYAGGLGLQEGVIIAGGFAFKFYMFWVAMALLVSVTNDHPWVEHFKLLL